MSAQRRVVLLAVALSIAAACRPNETPAPPRPAPPVMLEEVVPPKAEEVADPLPDAMQHAYECVMRSRSTLPAEAGQVSVVLSVAPSGAATPTVMPGLHGTLKGCLFRALSVQLPPRSAEWEQTLVIEYGALPKPPPAAVIPADRNVTLMEDQIATLKAARRIDARLDDLRILMNDPTRRAIFSKRMSRAEKACRDPRTRAAIDACDAELTKLDEE